MPNLPISGLPAGSALTGSELFAMVQNGVTKYTTLNNILYGKAANNYGLFNQTGSSIPVTGVAPFSGSLLDGGSGTISVPANTFQVGDAFQATMTGWLNVDQNGHTLEITVESDSTTLADTGVISMAKVSDLRFRLDIDFSINAIGPAGTAEIATAGTFQYRQDASSALNGEIFSLVNSSSFDTTIDNQLVINATWGASSNANDTIYSQIFTLRKVY